MFVAQCHACRETCARGTDSMHCSFSVSVHAYLNAVLAIGRCKIFVI